MIDNRQRELFNRLNGLRAAIKKQVCRYSKVISSLCGGKEHIIGGSVSICSICHKIRNKKGLWKYKQNFKEIPSCNVYSHVICPECLRIYYADLIQEK